MFPPAIALGVVLLAILLNYLRPIELRFHVSAPLRYGSGALVIAVAALGLGVWAIVTLRRSGESELPWTPTVRIVRRGPYRFTRNPLYLQLVLICAGLAIILMNVWMMLFTPVCGWLLQRLAIVPEEEYLQRKFGEEYLAYTRRVRRWL